VERERERERKDTKRYSTYKHIPTNNTFFDEKKKRELDKLTS
jgi:hypothetical protein